MGVREYVLATSAEGAARLAGEPGTVLMGGGTLLMPQATAGTLGAERVVGLHAAGLDYVQRNGATAIGAMSPLATLATLDDLPALRVRGPRGGRLGPARHGHDRRQPVRRRALRRPRPGAVGAGRDGAPGGARAARGRRRSPTG